VTPFYEPLIRPSINIDRHLFWCNFPVSPVSFPEDVNVHDQNSQNRYGFSLKGIKLKNRKDQILRNLVNPEIGLHFLNAAQGVEQEMEQISLF